MQTQLLFSAYLKILTRKFAVRSKQGINNFLRIPIFLNYFLHVGPCFFLFSNNPSAISFHHLLQSSLWLSYCFDEFALFNKCVQCVDLNLAEESSSAGAQLFLIYINYTQCKIQLHTVKSRKTKLPENFSHVLIPLWQSIWQTKHYMRLSLFHWSYNISRGVMILAYTILNNDFFMIYFINYVLY